MQIIWQKPKRLVDKANKNKDCRTYGDYREFLEKEKLDACLNCSS